MDEVHLGIRLPVGLRDRLRDMALAEDRPLSSMVRIILTRAAHDGNGHQAAETAPSVRPLPSFVMPFAQPAPVDPSTHTRSKPVGPPRVRSDDGHCPKCGFLICDGRCSNKACKA